MSAGQPGAGHCLAGQTDQHFGVDAGPLTASSPVSESAAHRGHQPLITHRIFPSMK
jgi:hypothetical protein